MKKISQYELMQQLKEREKELKCIYEIENILKDFDADLIDIFKKIFRVIPEGWQYSSICRCMIVYDNNVYKSPYYVETNWSLKTSFIIDGKENGYIKIVYTDLHSEVEADPFLPEEVNLIDLIADRISAYLYHQKVGKLLQILKSGKNVQMRDLNFLATKRNLCYSDWRLEMASLISEKTDLEQLGIKSIYLIGSVKNRTAGPASDIDLIVHYSGDEFQKLNISSWFEGWSYCLEEWNYIKTGIKTGNGLIDLHLITDEDISNKNSFATMITSYENSAKLLKTKIDT